MAEMYSIFIFINSGAMINLTDFASNLFKCTTNHVPHIYVLDSHRPIHLSNIFHVDLDEESEEYVSVPINIIAHDEDLDQMKRLYALQKSIDAEKILRNERESVDFEEESFFEEENDEDLRDFIVNDANQPDILPTIEEDGEHDEDMMEDVDNYREKNQLDIYYESVTYGLPSCVVLFRALNVSSKTVNKNDLLWWTIIGLTEYFIMDRIDSTTYQSLTQEFSGKVSAWNAEKRSTFQIQEINHQQNELSLPYLPISIPSTNDSRIKFIPEELIFFCYRHMPFLQSMQHTTAIYCAYNLWDTNGIDNLKYSLSKTGVSLEQLEMKWRSMKKQSRSDLKRAFLHGGHASFSQMDLKFSSFVKKYGMDLTVSASDMVYLLLSLLENVQSHYDINSLERMDPFGIVYEALQGNAIVIKKGIEEAIQLQRTLVYQCSDLLSSKRKGSSHGIKTVGSYFSAKIERPDPAFFHPLALTRLGLFILEVSRTSGLDRKRKNRRNKPIVISALNQERHRVIIVGIDVEGHSKNSFHTSFRRVCERTNVPLKNISFDTHVLELKTADLADFLLALYHEIDQIN